MDNTGASLSDLQLSSDELKRLKKAFNDPEFRRLFKEYADEISNPENRKKYEEEIKRMEFDRGMDVKFVNPEPCYCLKTRNWPELSTVDPKHVKDTSTAPIDRKSSKVFINVCKSEVVSCPEMKPVNKRGGSTPKITGHSKHGIGGGSQGWFWSVPHCFTPPHEEFDKRNNKVMVYDVAFHPKAFELASTSAAMRRLITITAVDGVQRQYSLRLGKNYQQAKQLAELTSPPTGDARTQPLGSTTADRPSSSSTTTAASAFEVSRDDLLLACVHTLKGTAYKGSSRPAVIRSRRQDYAERVADTQRVEAEALASCQTESQREAIRKLSGLGSSQSGDERQPETGANSGVVTPLAPLDRDKPGDGQVKDQVVQTPAYSVTHSSDFDMLNCRDTADVNPVKRPDRLCIVISLPGISSTHALDLQVTSSRLSLHSEKPVAYALTLDLPFPVDDTKGSAEFNKSSSQLRITLPVLPSPASAAESTAGDHQTEQRQPTRGTESEQQQDGEVQQGDNTRSQRKQQLRVNKRQRQRNRRVSSTAEETESSETSSSSSGGPTSGTVKATAGEVTCGQNSDCPVQQKTTSAVDSACSSSGGVPVAQVAMQQLTVSKDRRLAPVRFRQDPYSLTVLLDVRGILPDSLKIFWSDVDAQLQQPADEEQLFGGDQSQETMTAVPAAAGWPPALLMLVTFSSRGSGGCTMDWGVVLCCPSLAPIGSSQEGVYCRKKFFSSSLGSDEVAGGAEAAPLTDSSRQPRVISYRLSALNAVLVVAKPTCHSSVSTELRTTGSKAGLLSDRAVWWSSLATGRTLAAGMQHCPFIGMSEVSETASAASSPLGTPLFQTGVNSPRSPRQLVVAHLSADCCRVEWTANNKREELGKETQEQRQESTPSVPPVDLRSRSAVRRGGTPCEPAQLTAAAMAAPLGGYQPPRGILKQRSFSESSGDEQQQVCQLFANRQLAPFSSSSCLEATTLRMAGVAGSNTFLSTDEFPTDNSSAESVEDGPLRHFPPNPPAPLQQRRRRRWVSTLDGLSQRRPDSNPVPLCPPLMMPRLSSGRQRLRSVNFSQHDQKLDYSPKDTVETLHFTLLHRQRKVRRRQARRSNCSNSVTLRKTCPLASSSVGDATSSGDESGQCQVQPIDGEPTQDPSGGTTVSPDDYGDRSFPTGEEKDIVVVAATVSPPPEADEKVEAGEAPSVSTFFKEEGEEAPPPVEETTPAVEQAGGSTGSADEDGPIADASQRQPVTQRGLARPPGQMPVLLTSDRILELDQ